MASRAPEGYEALPEGEGDAGRGTPAQPTFAQQPTYTQPPAQQQPEQQAAAQQGAAPAAAAEPVLGLPAYPLPQQLDQFAHGQHARLRQQNYHSFPPYLGDLPPSAEEEWERATVLMSIWLGCSAATLAVSFLTANLLAVIGSLCATVGAATHRFACCRPASLGGDLGAMINRIFGMAVAAACLCSLVALFSLLIALGLSASCSSADDPKGCAEVTMVTTFYALWFTAYSALAVAVLKRTARMRSLLNPISSGVVAV